MKKLVILVSALSMACALNAASYVWGLASGDFQDHSGNELYTGTAFLYLGTVTASGTEFSTAGATYIASAGFDDTLWAYGQPSTETIQNSDAIASTAAGQSYSIVLLEESGVTSLDGYEGYYAIVNGTSIEGSIPGVTVTKYADFTNGTDSAYTTSYMAAPEPTSGLLLLLGMAGLALKRKRA